jgi:hypothetical protein
MAKVSITSNYTVVYLNLYSLYTYNYHSKYIILLKSSVTAEASYFLTSLSLVKSHLCKRVAVDWLTSLLTQQMTHEK